MSRSRSSSKSTTSLTLRIDADIKEAAEIAAKQDRRSLTNLIEVLLERHCRNLDLYPPSDKRNSPDGQVRKAS
ncbi:DUF6364 family protein [Lysobacter silvisoli]|uniref:DUF6364 family protein n=1 Tax=Lysobacter silvisoli TaxID=2293254 RepID=UPI003CCE3463